MSDNQLQVFISWSKEPSKQIAGCVRNLLEKIFPDPNIRFFLSSYDISVDENFVDILDERLASSHVGILILTKNNFATEWLMYEAGALAKGTKEKKTKQKLCPILFTREKEKIESPLKSFHCTIFEEQSFFDLICSIKQSIFNRKLLNDFQKNQLKHYLNEEWSDFEQKVKQSIQEHPDDTLVDMEAENNLSDIMMNEEAYEQILFKRNSHLQELIKNLPTDKSERIIIFGGISTILREDLTIIAFATWIVKNPNSKLLICYENADVASERAKDLNSNVYDPKISKYRELQKRKVSEFQRMKETLLGCLGKTLQHSVSFIEIIKPVSIYAMFHGNTCYLTPLLDKRSSDTFTFKLKDTKYTEEILLYLRSSISDNNENGHLLVNEIDLMIKNRSTDKEWDGKHGE